MRALMRLLLVGHALGRCNGAGALSDVGDHHMARSARRLVQRSSSTGPRLDKRRDRKNDSVVASLMAIDRLEHKAEPLRFLGWLDSKPASPARR